ncbi:phage tail sheath subtilisin-like domain-containing protein [Thauera propionica]|uniref:phage tail sheath subtilisin-like domain-containing protein n=1 Tax=Thauera propionica TaxID=2019431 RepID=UPI0023F53D7E|nr:phage tail sheath subtilisin-like domain-containing protein [Thauera propionica]MDD3677191.1 phage tail sheath subtilisin-like domain-containing protein [Thauera propionica]
MADRFLHGIELIEIEEGGRTVRTVNSSVIGVVGTAPQASPARTATLTLGQGDAALTFTAKAPGALGNTLRVQISVATEPDAPLAVALDTRTPGTTLIRVTLATDYDGSRISTAAEVAQALMAEPAIAARVSVTAGGEGTGVVAATLGSRGLDGGMDEPFPLNVPVLVSSKSMAAHLGESGTLPQALRAIQDHVFPFVYVVRVKEGVTLDETMNAVIGGLDPVTGQLAGIAALQQVRAEMRSRIMIAPGFSQHKAVADALIAVAQKTRAIAVIDGPNLNDEAAVDYRAQFGSDRAYVVDPWLVVRARDGSEQLEPPSARVAGLIAKSDAERGFWFSPSNQVINGALRPARPVSWAINDPNTQANYLSELSVATFVVHDGIRLWGNRTCATDSRFAFLSVRRTADMINESLLRAHLWAMDRNITRTYVEEVTEGVNAYLRQLKAQGAILGGRCWADRELNTPESIADGRVYFDFEFTAPYPAEHIIFRSHLVGDYLEEIL